MATTKIDRRDDVNPDRGEKEYGDVKFADPVNNKYPIDSEKHVREPGATLITKTMPQNMTKMRSS